MKRYDYYEDISLLTGKTDIEAVQQLTKPTIIRVKGQDDSKAVLVSSILHGCEPCGFRAVLKELNSEPDYPFDVYYFFGNVKSAQVEPVFTHRLVPGGQNFNRIWTDNPTTEDEHTAKDILEFLETLPLTAVLDIHSFTAKNTNPHGFIESHNKKTVELAKKLLPTTFITEGFIGAMIERTEAIAPSLVIECGTNGSKEADIFAYESLQRFFIATGVKDGQVEDICTGIYDGMTNIKIKPDASVAWADEPQDVDVTLRTDANTLNHKELPHGEPIGYANNLDVFIVTTKDGTQDPATVFELKDGKILLKHAVVPNLMSTNERISKESGFYFFQPTK